MTIPHFPPGIHYVNFNLSLRFSTGMMTKTEACLHLVFCYITVHVGKQSIFDAHSEFTAL